MKKEGWEFTIVGSETEAKGRKKGVQQKELK